MTSTPDFEATNFLDIVGNTIQPIATCLWNNKLDKKQMQPLVSKFTVDALLDDPRQPCRLFARMPLQGQIHLAIATRASNDPPAIKFPKNWAYVIVQKNSAQTFRSLPTQSRESTCTRLFIASF